MFIKNARKRDSCAALKAARKLIFKSRQLDATAKKRKYLVNFTPPIIPPISFASFENAMIYPDILFALAIELRVNNRHNWDPSSFIIVYRSHYTAYYHPSFRELYRVISFAYHRPIICDRSISRKPRTANLS